jgi:hypothetical protein
LRSGDVYVSVILKPVTAETLKRYFDPGRTSTTSHQTIPDAGTSPKASGDRLHPTFLQGAQLEEPNPLDIPSTGLYHAVLDNLLMWVDHNVAPPHADPILVKPVRPNGPN